MVGQKKLLIREMGLGLINVIPLAWEAILALLQIANNANRLKYVHMNIIHSSLNRGLFCFWDYYFEG